MAVVFCFFSTRYLTIYILTGIYASGAGFRLSFDIGPHVRPPEYSSISTHLVDVGVSKWSAFSAAYLRFLETMILLSTIVIPKRWVSLFIIGLYASEAWWRLSFSIEHCNSIRSGSAAVSLIRVSRSSMKSSSAALTLSSCFFALTLSF